MLKKTITYKSFDGETEETDDFYFNLTKMEVFEINLMEDLAAVGKSKDPKRIIPTLKRIVRHSIGQKIGERFIKTEDFADAFIASEAYSELFMEIFGSDNAEQRMAEFIKGIVPSDVSTEQAPLPIENVVSE